MRCFNQDCESCNPYEPYTCLEHGIRFGSDGLMCPACEEEICREHDDTLKEIENETA